MSLGRRLARSVRLDRVPASVTLAALLGSACSATVPTLPSAAPIISLELRHSDPLFTPQGLTPGTSVSFRAVELDADLVEHDVTNIASWGSDAPAVFARDTRFGVGTFAAGTTAGTAGISASVHGRTASATATNNGGSRPAPALVLSGSASFGSSATVDGSSTFVFATYHAQVGFLVTDTNVTAQAVWTSQNPDIATASAGRVTAVRPGNAIIRVSYNGLTSSGEFGVPGFYTRPRLPPLYQQALLLFRPAAPFLDHR